MAPAPESDGLGLELLEGPLAVCRLGPEEPFPAWAVAAEGPLLASVRSASELSVVCAEGAVPASATASAGWRAIRVAGTLAHDLTGVLASLAAPLAEAGIPIFAISTYDTDYLLVPEPRLEDARRALAGAGHRLG